MAEINDLNVTDANNTARFPEGMILSTVNDSGRALEGMLARWFSDSSGILITTGSGNAYTITATRSFAAYVAGMRFGVKFHIACNATPTFRVGALATKTLVRQTGSAIVAGDIATGTMADVVYDSANDRFMVMGLDDREKAAIITTAALPTSTANNKGTLYSLDDPPGANTEPCLVIDTGTRLSYLRERFPTFTNGAGANQRPASSSTTSGKISIRTDHVQDSVLAFDTGSGWKDVDDVLDIYTTATLPAVGSSTKGWVVYNDTTDFLAVFSGTEWDVIRTHDPSLVNYQLPSYTVSTLPSAATNVRCTIYVSNESGGATPAFSDGTNWRRFSDRAVVS